MHPCVSLYHLVVLAFEAWELPIVVPLTDTLLELTVEPGPTCSTLQSTCPRRCGGKGGNGFCGRCFGSAHGAYGF